MKSLVNRLIRAGIATPNQIKGCTTMQVDEVRIHAGGKLPKIYEEFLFLMGRGAGGFFAGTDMFYPELLSNRTTAQELLEEDQSPFKLSESDFVFSSHQGYQFMYFNVDIDDPQSDPPVYYYNDGDGFPVRKWERFSDYLLEAIKDHENLPFT